MYTNKYNFMFKSDQKTGLNQYQNNLLNRIWQAGQSLKFSSEGKLYFSKKLDVKIDEALVLDDQFLMVKSGQNEMVYEICFEGFLP